MDGGDVSTGYGLVTFLSDFGTDDPYVAICHGVLARFAPDARVVDVTHQVPPQDVRRGAAVLARAVPWFPPAVHLAVVDPGVGTDRRAVAVRTASAVLVGPDNGLLPPAADALGGARHAVQLADEERFLRPVSRTFHGRDVFSPCAGQIAAGVPLADFGPELDAASLVRLPEPVLRVQGGAVRCEVTYVDRYGNLQLSCGPDDLVRAGLAQAAALAVTTATATIPVRRARAYGDAGAGDLLLYEESSGRLELAVAHGSAAAMLGLAAGDEVTLTSPD